MRLSRRTFLQAAALGIGATPGVLLRAAEELGASTTGDQVLVVVQLSGGNDGLNTLVPYESDEYQRSRPTLALRSSDVLRIDQRAPIDVGFHPEMGALRELFDAGHVAVVQGIGYPNPSRSHFRSMDIWHTARPDREDIEKGWLGRALEDPRRDLTALQVGDDRFPLALAGEKHVPSLQNLDFLDFLASGRGKDMRRLMAAVHEPPRTGAVERVRGLARTTVDSLEKIIAVREKDVPVEYPDSDLAQRLQWAGQMIAGGYPSRIFYLSQSGYDTHAQQRDSHAVLVRRLSEAIGAFHRHMEATECARRVTVLVFSEFGRRLEENGSLGTDHGCAAPAFVISGRARGGLHGEYPSLTKLDHGDLEYDVDFRRVYATLLERVLGVAAEPVLGGRFEPLDLLA